MREERECQGEACRSFEPVFHGVTTQSVAKIQFLLVGFYFLILIIC